MGNGKYEMNQTTALSVDHTFYENAANLIAESRKMVASTANTDLAIQQKASAEFKLSWSHYQVLMRISDKKMRKFYEIEAFEGQWSVPQLKRQYNSSLYERLALSRNKEEVLKLANEGQVIEKPQDVLKNPFVLEFLGMEEKAAYSESDLESAIISKLQNFLLELGKGFLFEAHQMLIFMPPNIVYIYLIRNSYRRSWMNGHMNMSAARINDKYK